MHVKSGRPSEMLKMYYDNIEKFGNDPSNAGVDTLLEKYAKKYNEYDVLTETPLDFSTSSSPTSMVSFSYVNRGGIEETHEEP